MAEKRRGPGRPAYDSKQKLVAATCALLAERGYEATSPKMILDRARVGQGSMYHHYRGKEDLALDAIAHMRERSVAFLEGRTHQGPPTEAAAALTMVEVALAGLFERNEGHALIRLLADPTVGAISPLAVATQGWCDDLRAAIIAGFDTDTPIDPEAAETATRILAPELDTLATTLLTGALGHGLIGLPRAVLDHPRDRLPDGLLNP